MDLPLIIGAGVAVAAVAVLVIWRQPVFAFTQRSVGFIREVRGEVRKVAWPSWDDLRRSTVVITIIVIIIGIIIGIMDFIFSKLLIDFFGRAFG
ncbi:MAG: preprotein translocase subunit SecE [Gemmatimonadales bacterium]|nr:preprotein translocase subunit SecE [Gemmatimonadales bacterium]